MISPLEFDIFRTDKDGHLIWCAAEATFEEAKARAEVLAASDPCAYVIFRQKTGAHTPYITSLCGEDT